MPLFAFIRNLFRAGSSDTQKNKTGATESKRKEDKGKGNQNAGKLFVDTDSSSSSGSMFHMLSESSSSGDKEGLFNAFPDSESSDSSADMTGGFWWWYSKEKSNDTGESESVDSKTTDNTSSKRTLSSVSAHSKVLNKHKVSDNIESMAETKQDKVTEAENNSRISNQKETSTDQASESVKDSKKSKRNLDNVDTINGNSLNDSKSPNSETYSKQSDVKYNVEGTSKNNESAGETGDVKDGRDLEQSNDSIHDKTSSNDRGPAAKKVAAQENNTPNSVGTVGTNVEMSTETSVQVCDSNSGVNKDSKKVLKPLDNSADGKGTKNSGGERKMIDKIDNAEKYMNSLDGVDGDSTNGESGGKDKKSSAKYENARKHDPAKDFNLLDYVETSKSVSCGTEDVAVYKNNIVFKDSSFSICETGGKNRRSCMDYGNTSKKNSSALDIISLRDLASRDSDLIGKTTKSISKRDLLKYINLFNDSVSIDDVEIAATSGKVRDSATGVMSPQNSGLDYERSLKNMKIRKNCGYTEEMHNNQMYPKSSRSGINGFVTKNDNIATFTLVEKHSVDGMNLQQSSQSLDDEEIYENFKNTAKQDVTDITDFNPKDYYS